MLTAVLVNVCLQLPGISGYLDAMTGIFLSGLVLLLLRGAVVFAALAISRLSSSGCRVSGLQRLKLVIWRW